MLSLAVMWSELDGPARPGRLDLSGTTLRLEGGSRDAAHGRELDVSEIGQAYMGRTESERIGGHSTLVLALRAGGTLRVAGVGHAGGMRELTERIQELLP